MRTTPWLLVAALKRAEAARRTFARFGERPPAPGNRFRVLTRDGT